MTSTHTLFPEAPHRPRPRGAVPSQLAMAGLVTLCTAWPEASQAQPRLRGRKRSADSSKAGEGRASKRGRIPQEDIEEIDLSKDPPSKEEELLQQQQEETIKQQQAAEESQGPLKIGQRTCIICMENFTNCTIASCGEYVCMTSESCC